MEGKWTMGALGEPLHLIINHHQLVWLDSLVVERTLPVGLVRPMCKLILKATYWQP